VPGKGEGDKEEGAIGSDFFTTQKRVSGGGGKRGRRVILGEGYTKRGEDAYLLTPANGSRTSSSRNRGRGGKGELQPVSMLARFANLRELPTI